MVIQGRYPNFSVHDLYVGWTEALTALGEEVAVYNMDDRLLFYQAALLETGEFDDDGHPQVKKALTDEQAVGLAATGLMNAAYQWWPDVILLISAFFVPPDLIGLMRQRGHKVVLLHTEQPYQADEQLVRAAHASVNLLNDPSGIEAYRDLGMPAEYVPHCYRPSLHHPGAGRPEVQCDLGFVGTAYDSRIKFFEAMNLDGLDVLLAGHWKMLPEGSPLRRYVAHDIEECLANDSAAEIYRGARSGINFYRRESEEAHAGEGWALSPREVEMSACELFFLRDSRGEGDGLLSMLPVFDGPGDASEKLRWWLAHDDERAEAASLAREAIADRTFENAAKSLLRLLDRQPARM